jgi:exodeoxyribonuclease V gamma subunit
VRHPLQSFSPAYFDGKNPSLFSYSAADLRTTMAISAGPGAERVVFPAPLPLPAEFSRKIRLEELCEFVANPARYLFTRRLNVRYRSDDEVLEGSEPLVVGKAETRSIRSALMEGLRRGELRNAAEFQRLFERLTADAKLPPGLAGRTGYEGQLQEMAPVLEAYRSLLRKEPLERIAGVVKIGEWELEVEISTGLTVDGLHHAKPGDLRGKDILPFWTKFLAVSLVHPNPGTLEGSLLGIKKNTRKEIQPDLLVFRQETDAAEVLSVLLHWYEIGICRPIRLFPEASWAYAKELDAKGEPGAALEKAEAAWIPADEEYGFREGNDEYFSRLFPPDETALDGEFLQITEALAVRAYRALLTGGKPAASRSRKKK